MTIEDKILNFRMRLPLPSDERAGRIQIPVDFNHTEQDGYGAIVFEKEYYNGICIGWKLVK